MLKVCWNKERTWKITKKYVNGKLHSFKHYGIWYVPVHDYRGLDYDGSGNCYIASDCCDYCHLEKECESGNPIKDACAEFNLSCMRMEIMSKNKWAIL